LPDLNGGANRAKKKAADGERSAAAKKGMTACLAWRSAVKRNSSHYGAQNRRGEEYIVIVG